MRLILNVGVNDVDNKVDGILLIALSKLRDDLLNFKDLTRGGDCE